VCVRETESERLVTSQLEQVSRRRHGVGGGGRGRGAKRPQCATKGWLNQKCVWKKKKKVDAEKT